MFTDIITRTIKCDGPECGKTHTFNPKDEADVKALEGVTWLKDSRIVSRGDQRQFCYCSDVCEVQAITAGTHNFPEQPKVHGATEADVKRAALGAAAADALKTSDASDANAKVTLS